MNGGGNILVNNGLVKKTGVFFYLEHSNLKSIRKRRIKAWTSIPEEKTLRRDWKVLWDCLKYI